MGGAEVGQLDDVTGELTIQFTIKEHRELYGNQPEKAERYLCIDEAGVVIPLDDNFDPDMIDAALEKWLIKPPLVTRGLAVKVRDVVAKLKRLDFSPLPQKGTSHLHFMRPDGMGKVTIPIHSGEIAKGTFKSILNQAGIDLRTFQMA